MRRINKNSQIDKILKQTISILFIFVVFVTIGALLNKIYPNAKESIIQNIQPTVDYYNADATMRYILVSNIKTSLLFMGSIYIFSLIPVTFPIVVTMIVVKAISIGYTINTAILALKLESIKFVMITLFKNMAIIPGAIVLTIISVKYILEILKVRKNKSKLKFYIKQYSINSAIIIILTISSQTIINAISIATLQKLL